MGIRTLNRSFGGGEITPEMFGRIDDAKYQTGVALCRNFITKPHGPAENRAGFAYVNTVKTSAKKTRLIPFTYSTTQTMVLEFGDSYIRFHTQGATLQTSGVPALPSNVVNSVTITIASPGVVTWNSHGFAAGTPVRLVTNGALPTGLSTGTTYYVVNPATNTFQLAATVGGTAINTSGTQSGTHYAVYQYSIGDLFTYSGTQYYRTSSSSSFFVTATANNGGKIRVTTDYDLVSLSEGARVRIFGVGGTTEANGEWTISNLVITSLTPLRLSFDLNGSTYVNAYTSGGVATTSVTPGSYPTAWYALTGSTYEIPSPYAEADLFDLHYVQSADVMTIVHPNYPPRELRRYGATNWQLSTINFSSTLSAPTGVTATATGTGTLVYKYVVVAVGTNGIDQSLASSVASCTNNLFTTGNSNTIAWSAVSGAQRYYVYKFSGGLYGYIGQSDSLSFVDDNIAAQMGTTPLISNNPFSSSGNYPGAVSYYEQRRVFAGTINQPQNIWMTRTGTESNLSYSLPTKDDDAIAFRVAAREANTIRHIVPLTSLVLLTGAAEWRVTSVNSDAITPSTVSVKPQSYVGASNVQPVVINNQMIYAAARGGHMRELAYSWQANGFITGDLSLRAPHLFDNLSITDMAYGKSPQPIVWCVSSNGKLLGLTYVPEQQVGSWHQHDTDGTFESVCVVAEGNEDRLYAVVKRTVNGSSVRYVERMASRQFIAQSDAFFVDAGATFDGTNTSATTVTVSGGTTWGSSDTLTITASSALFAYPAQTDVNDAIVFTDTDGSIYRLTILSTTSTVAAQARVDKTLPAAFRNTATASFIFARDSISGLTWLEGKSVSILADGAVHPQRIVTGGTITLDRAVGKAQIGLPITADLQTLPWYAQIDAAFGQGRAKNVNKIWLRVYRSSGIFAGPSASKLTEAKQRTTEPYGSPPALKSDEIPLVIDPSWNQSGQVFIRQSDPLPLTLVSMTLDVAIGA